MFSQNTPDAATNIAIVIGAGIAGCSSAFALAQRGWRVTLIERESQLASGASGNPSAILYARLTGNLNTLNELASASFKHSIDLLKKLKLSDADYQVCGVLQLSFNARELNRHLALTHENSPQNTEGIAEYLNQAEASKVAGINLNYGGLYIKNAGWVNPRVYCQALANHPNINICYSTNVLDLNFIDKEWQVSDEMRIIAQAAVVIIANANDANQFSQTQHLALRSVRGQITLLPCSNSTGLLKTIVCADSYICPAIAGLHNIGSTFRPNDDNPYLSVEDHIKNLSGLAKISPELTRLNSHCNSLLGRVAWRSQTPDYLPLVGRVLDAKQLALKTPRYNADPASLPWLTGLYVNAGHGSKGLITAPYCAELITAHITKQLLSDTESLLSALNPNRFLLRQMGLKQLAKTALM